VDVSSFFYGTDRPYQTWNTLNYTNTGTMSSFPGFRFEFFDTGMPGSLIPQRAANFVNAGSVDQGSASVYGSTWLFVKATNVVDHGTLGTGSRGVIHLMGDNVDLSRGLLEVGYGSEFSTAGIWDEYWGISTNLLTARFTPGSATSSATPVEQLIGQFYYTNTARFTASAGAEGTLQAYVSRVTIDDNPDQAQDLVVDVLIIGNRNPSVIPDVRFFTTTGPTEKVVRWEGITTNRVTGETLTNSVFLYDDFAARPTPRLEENYGGGRGTPGFNPTFRPGNYFITRNLTWFDMLEPMVPEEIDPALFQGTNSPDLRDKCRLLGPVDCRIQSNRCRDS
jgi:hypothetical protein